jgi:hypothetical protein
MRSRRDRPPPKASTSKTRRKSRTSPTTTPKSTTESAEPNPQSTSSLIWVSIWSAIISTLPPPRRAGVMKKPIEKMKTSRTPEVTPGMLRGRYTRRKVGTSPAPRFAAARR